MLITYRKIKNGEDRDVPIHPRFWEILQPRLTGNPTKKVFNDYQSRDAIGLFDDVVRLESERLRDGQPQRLGGFEIDHQLERVRYSTGRSAGLAPFRIWSTNTATRCSVSRVYSW
jgi:hypothetical protein